MWPTSIGFGGANRCRGCDHPRPAYNGAYASVRTNLGTMLSMAKYTGCETCAVLSEGILNFLSEDDEVSREEVDELRIDFNMTGSRRSIEVVLMYTPVTLSFFCSEHTPWILENMPDLPVGNEVPEVTSSDESLSWAIQQLEHCKASHKDCNANSSSSLPSRVLDVRAQGESGVRLYVSNGEQAPYTALSHCWGHRPFLRTLSGSLDAHRDEIIWSRLPKSFQNAVEFTRKLGIRYLWIDSLCIIQDDQHDWRREAAKMASIYQNATLVISAARSSGAYGGLYADLPPSYKTHTIHYAPGGDDETSSLRSSSSESNHQDITPVQPPKETIHLRRALTHSTRLLSPYHAQSHATTLPLFTRGWILQERLLSPRILHFSAHELAFECLTTSTCQCTPSSSHECGAIQPSAPAWYNHMLDRTARPKHYYSPLTWRERMDTAEVRLCWRRLVEDYTRLRLTYGKDVFPAVSGMAQAMQGVRGGERYVAGLWKGVGVREGDGKDSGFVEDLLWHVELPPKGHTGEEDERGKWEWRKRPAEWRAPSWSWAAVGVPVEFLTAEEGVEASCEVVDVRCEPAGPDLMGELVEGGSYLVVKGRLVPAMLRFRKEEETEPWNLIDLDILDGGHMKNLWADDDCQSLVSAEGEQTKVYCLLVGRKLPRRELLCLVLAQMPTEEGSVARDRDPTEDRHFYRRIGMLEIFGGPPSPVLWGWVHNLLGKGEDKTIRIV